MTYAIQYCQFVRGHYGDHPSIWRREPTGRYTLWRGSQWGGMGNWSFIELAESYGPLERADDPEAPKPVDLDAVTELISATPDTVPEPPRAAVLREAEGLITGDRNKSYGSPTQNFTNTAEIWTALLRHKLTDGAVITPSEVASLMVGLKLARTVGQPKRDNWVDMAGYAACGYETQIESEGGE